MSPDPTVRPTNPCPDRNAYGHRDCAVCDAWADARRAAHRARAAGLPNPCPDRYTYRHDNCPACDAWAAARRASRVAAAAQL